MEENSTSSNGTNMPDSTDPSSNHPMLIVVMGVSGCGKSTLCDNLAKSLSLPALDADDLHPKSNVAKMSAGIPLTDDDRAPWLAVVRTTVEHICVEQDVDPNFQGRKGVVVACSALKKKYRDLLRGEEKPESLPEHLEPPHSKKLPTYFVFMKGARETMFERMSSRQGHFMKSEMLDSQLQTLEDPEGENGVVVVRVEDSSEQQLATAMEGLTRLAGDL